MKVGILAAGEGSRLQAAGLSMPKPLLPVGGVPLIGYLLQALSQVEVEQIVCVINSRGGAVADYVKRHYPAMQVTFIERDTRSSFESFQLLCAALHGAPFLVTTVDTLFAPAFLSEFLQVACCQTGIDMMLTLTTFIDDEKPLYVCLDDQQRIVQLGAAAYGSSYVTSGIYYCAPCVSTACATLTPGRLGALREFLAWLLQQGYWLQGYLAPTMIDVDRPQDIAVAEQFLRDQGWQIAPAGETGVW
jgi:NDP-sugar pyrophosphorylase family protein